MVNFITNISICFHFDFQICEVRDTPDSTPEDDEAPETATEAPDMGPCPNCGQTKWVEDEEGDWDCAKCHHPFGEPAGDRDEGLFRTQRSKTVKTAEALIRAFADLNRFSPAADYKAIIDGARTYIRIAKDWK